ncbi:MAG: hypothetical protein ACOCR8_04250 [Desulfosalsimonas sp.]
MSIKPGQLRQAIRESIRDLNPQLLTEDVVELLMLTAAQESHCGKWLWQDTGDGGNEIPENLAYGIFQMEEPAFKEAMSKVLRYKPHAPVGRRRLIFDLRLSIWCARCYYLRFPEPLPDADNPGEIARYWKKYWNTRHGAGKPEEALENYRRFALEQ